MNVPNSAWKYDSNEGIQSVWPVGWIILSIFGHLQHWTIAQQHWLFAKVGSTFCQIRNKLYKIAEDSIFFQSCQISPNLVTLELQHIVYSCSVSWLTTLPCMTSDCCTLYGNIKKGDLSITKTFFIFDGQKFAKLFRTQYGGVSEFQILDQCQPAWPDVERRRSSSNLSNSCPKCSHSSF